ncbi:MULTISPECIES: MarR family winged helix-turn-helix transcriptional regulator [Pseudonocardia]|uniref:HTH-type transcriptional regulator MhqR n=2 Tax=Pseudonocardia TaxID=1847 RepID=A0A1Y2N2X0_PSEAH|nr:MULTISPECIES: MarR family transcriptional regulator [Pseudonocardia]OSY41509.1 HTH-type transcriptional regulator MhqR [Pseudonocardia autotrophica]TDN71464.1 MarR family transcriptional regulator [Pseudonocardia autotrophica]BBG02140.1 MarR family transcriptional regulator [Pseudonocardia autotrophica]GEC24154.1 MarR family transcriptional regulator [Pseudonocardia saturnea]
MEHTRWLDDEEQRTWRAFLATQRLVLEHVERRLQSNAGMPQAYYEILVRLSEAPGRTLRMSVLAESSWSSRSRLSHAVARMEEAGWVVRRSCPTDRRGQLAELTDEGFEVLRTAAPDHVESVREALFDGLTPAQQAGLREACETVVEHLSGAGQWPVTGDAGPDGPGAARAS